GGLHRQDEVEEIHPGRSRFGAEGESPSVAAEDDVEEGSRAAREGLGHRARTHSAGSTENSWENLGVLTSEMFPRGRRKWGEISKIGEMSRDFPGLRLSSPGLLFSSGGSARRGTRRSGRRWRPSRSRKRANCERSHPLRARTPTP